jgi:hypothetical protein
MYTASMKCHILDSLWAQESECALISIKIIDTQNMANYCIGLQIKLGWVIGLH